jgi:hypothetical protein
MCEWPIACFYAWQVDAASDEQEAVGVAKIVIAKRLQAGGITGAFEAAPES